MSSFASPVGYPINAPAYGVATVAFVNFASNPAGYAAKPGDYVVLLDLSAYPGAGPNITISQPVEDFPVLVRNVAGSGAAHNWTVTAPAGCTIEDPANPGSFGASATISSAFGSGTWAFDRPRARFFLYPPTGATGGAPALTAFGADLVNSTPTLQWVAAISGNGGLGGTVPLNVTTLQFAQPQVAPTISQATQLVGLAPQSMTLAPQPANAGATNATNGTSGDLNASLGAPFNGGTFAGFNVRTAGAIGVRLGPSAAAGDGTIWLGLNAPTQGGGGNWNLRGDGVNLVLRPSVGNGGSGLLQSQGLLTPLVWVDGGLQLLNPAGVTNFGGGVNVIGISQVTTVPTTAPATAGLIMWSNAGAVGSLGLFATGMGFHRLAGAIAVRQDAQTTDIAATAFAVQAQSALAGAAVNVNGAGVRLEGGDAASNGVTGVRGGASLVIGRDPANNNLVEVVELAPGRRAVILGNVGASFQGNGSAAGIPNGDGIVAIANAITVPLLASANNTSLLWAGVLAPGVTSGVGLNAAASGAPGVDAPKRTLVPATGDTVNSQAMLQPERVRLFRITSNATAQDVTGTVTAKSGRVEIIAVGRTTTAGAAGAVGDSVSFSTRFVYHNVAGTVVIEGTSLGLAPEITAASHATTAMVITASTAFYVITLTGAANAGAVVDWEWYIRETRI